MPIAFFIMFQLLLTYFITQTRNPYIMSLLLIAQAFVYGLCCWALQMKWVGLSLIMIFIGGMMVLFLYVASLTSSAKVHLKWASLPVLGFSVLWAYNTMPQVWNLELNGNAPSLIFLGSQSMILVFLMAYLLILLLVVVKILESFKGALVEKF